MLAVTTDKTMLSLHDAALLAGVRREVATTWRSRYVSSPQPFPVSIARHRAGHELFDATEVVDWLDHTGYGHNRSARDDVIAFTITAADVVDDDVVFAGLTALLCLQIAGGNLPDDEQDLLDLAERYDPDDELLFGEVEALADRLLPTARYAELLVSAAFDPTDPFDELMRRRSARDRSHALHPTLRQLISRAALALADEADFTEPVLVVRSVADVDLLIAAARDSESRGPLRTAVVLPDPRSTEPDPGTTEPDPRSLSLSKGALTDPARLARRWLSVHDIRQVEIAADDGYFELPDQAVVLTRLHGSGTEREPDLSEVSALCDSLSDRQLALVVGSAATLTAPLRAARGPGRPAADSVELSPAGEARVDALRSSRVRAVLRLPRGLLPDQPRAHAALWALGPVPVRPESTLCGRIEEPLAGFRVDDLVTDLVLSLHGPGRGRTLGHHTAQAGFQPTSGLILSTDDLAAPVVRPVADLDDQALAEVQGLLDATARTVPGLTEPALQVGRQPQSVARRSLGDAVRTHDLQLIQGARVDLDGTAPAGDHPVVRTATDLDRRSELPAYRLVDLVARHPGVQLSRAGDVIFSASAAEGPRAMVDRTGGCVVAYPARILRCTPKKSAPRFAADAIAADINALSRTSLNPRGWPLTVVPSDQVAALDATLLAVAAQRAALTAAVAELDRLVPALTRVVAARLARLPAPAHQHPDQHPNDEQRNSR